MYKYLHISYNFLNILGGIISADEKEVKTEEIEYKFCNIELKDVIKIVIIQACQGKVIGNKNFYFITLKLIYIYSFIRNFNCRTSRRQFSYRWFYKL